jgi:tetratricopeptide (TPR) repeat protein
VHYTIHANDFAGREHESLEVVRRYGAIAPDNPHALHMPTHIFVRLGAWEDVIDWNRRAARAALAQRVGPNGEYVWDEYPHAAEYLVYAHLQRGDDDAAGETIRSVAAAADLEPGFKTAFHLAAPPVRYALERRDWAQAARMPVRSPSWVAWDRFPWPEALTVFARGLGGAHTGESAIVDESIERLERLRLRAAESGEAYFAGQIEILRLEVAAWRAQAAGKADTAVRLMLEAEALERGAPKHPVTPGAILPASELLGDLYLALGDPARALEAYRRSEQLAPGRLNGLLGLARASAALGDRGAAGGFYRRLIDGAAPVARRPAVAEARRFLGAVR